MQIHLLTLHISIQSVYIYHPSSASIIHVYIWIYLPIYLYIYMFTSLSTCKAACNIIWAPRSFQNNSLVIISQEKLCNNCWAKASGQGLSSGGKGGYVFLTASVGMDLEACEYHIQGRKRTGRMWRRTHGGTMWKDPRKCNFKHTLLWSGKGIPSRCLCRDSFARRRKLSCGVQGTRCGAQSPCTSSELNFKLLFLNECC